MTCLAFLIAFAVIFLDRYDNLINGYRRFVSKNKEKYKHPWDGPYWRSPAFWSRVLSKNLLALSDTQLLTGLAVQFTALLKHCSLSVYHFRIVTELAFLTTVTHLLTVVALRNYFVKYPWVNLPRICLMLANLGILGYTSFVAYSYDLAGLDVSMSLACFFQGDRPRLAQAFGGKWAALLIGAIGGHVTVILAMYFLKEPDAARQRSWLWYLGAAFRTWIVAPIYSIYGIYMAGDGFQGTQALGTPIVNLQGSEREWGFGQFLPVLLLALPLLAGWESFWEEWDEDRENRFGRHMEHMAKIKADAEAKANANANGPVETIEIQAPKQASSEVQRRSRDISIEEKALEASGPVLTHS